ncbi:MAG: hypothetical protein HY716_18030 [Planctomycetes bacterium]|nr:hypothetical protein [Planctomycetota bacterium]
MLLFLLAAPQEGDRAAKPELDFTFTIEEQSDGTWAFVVDGTSSLPDGAILKAREYYLEANEFRGGQLDEHRIDDRRRPDYHPVEVRGGKFRDVVFTCARRPYSLRYRVKLLYDPVRQDPELAAKAGVAEFAAARDLRMGNDAMLDKEMKESMAEIARDMKTILGLYRDLNERFTAWFQTPNEEAYKKWYQELRENLDELEARNQTRFSIWAVWLEYQAKMRIESFIETFQRLCKDFETWKDKGKRIETLKKKPGDHAGEIESLRIETEELLERLRGTLEYFKLSYEESHEVLGLEDPFDPEAVAAWLRTYEKAVSALSDLASKKDFEAWKAGFQEPRRRAQAALYEIRRLMPRGSHERILLLAQDLMKLCDVQERVAAGGALPDLVEATRSHQGMIADFKKYAGLKE